jgi:hypothetical protein
MALGVLDGAAVVQIGVMPVARKVWQQVEEGRPAARERRLIISSTSVRASGRRISAPNMRRRCSASLGVRFGKSNCFRKN